MRAAGPGPGPAARILKMLISREEIEGGDSLSMAIPMGGSHSDSLGLTRSSGDTPGGTPGGTQEAPRRHPGGTQNTSGSRNGLDTKSDTHLSDFKLFS